MRRISPKAFSLIVLVLVIVSIPVFAAVRYTFLLKRTPVYQRVQSWGPDSPLPRLTKEQARQLGKGHSDDYHPHYSYILYPKEKPPNVVRIGLFGDSFVEGAEVAPGHEFPSLLQKKFDRAGFTNIEVINFGLGGRGVSSMYLLWQYLGRDYDLDYVVFFPFDFHQLRDESFCNVCTHERVFARFIIHDDGLRLIPIVGDSMREAVETYHSFFAPWRYIRYDNKMPMFLKVFLPESLQHRTNPFYYKLRIFNKGEILDIYRMMFDDVAKQVTHLVIVANDDDILSLKETIEASNVSVLQSQVRFINSLYYAPKWHNSAMGNDLRAAELFSWFRGEKAPALKIVEFLPEGVPQRGIEGVPPLPLHDYPKVHASLGKSPIADFVTGMTKHYYRGAGEKFDFQDSKTVSLLAVIPRVGRMRFLPLDFMLKESAPVALTFKLNGALIEVPLGVIETTSGVIGRLRMKEQDELIKQGDNWSLKIQPGSMLLEGKGTLDELQLMMNDRKILKASLPEKPNMVDGQTTVRLHLWKFVPFQGEWIHLRGAPGQYMDVESVPVKDGTLDLVLTSKDGKSDRYPILPYTIYRMNTMEFNPPISNSMVPHP